MKMLYELLLFVNSFQLRVASFVRLFVRLVWVGLVCALACLFANNILKV